ncbi:hypothetical protein RHMOL_Rhmol02G0230000 [Rhododendron molle]|uniref:Uncharacterized protein n=1 Tax=Rhododendron molle TaxID=49168 RepID=A0ACC0PUI7_RHOML|nr:hypothetical protein RHMOL_Rhmol02G0230000 [Rhododendron molle]
MMVQETKIEKLEIESVQRIWGNSEVEFAESGSVGSSGVVGLIFWGCFGCLGKDKELGCLSLLGCFQFGLSFSGLRSDHGNLLMRPEVDALVISIALED